MLKLGALDKKREEKRKQLCSKRVSILLKENTTNTVFSAQKKSVGDPRAAYEFAVSCCPHGNASWHHGN